MESNINLYKFIFYKPFSENKQHNYTHNRYMKQILLNNGTVYHLHQCTFLLLFKARQRRNNNFYSNSNNNINTTTCNSKFELIFLYPVKT